MVEMNPKALKSLCRELGLYTTPEVNDILYLHYKGWAKIENLEAYNQLKVIYLEGNGFGSIQGLEALTKLKCLYLQENLIKKIENLESQTELDSLNLSQNRLSKIENLAHMTKLTTLLLEKNQIKSAEDIEHVLEVPSLSVINLSNNKVDDPTVIDIFEKMPDLRVLYLKGNPVTGKIKNYRKTLISRIKTLTYLDDRPVFPEERLTAEAWAIGGAEGEKAERARQKAEKEEKDKRNMDWFTDTFVKGKKYTGTNKEGVCEYKEAEIDSNKSKIQIVGDGDDADSSDNNNDDDETSTEEETAEEPISVPVRRSPAEEKKTKTLFDDDFGVANKTIKKSANRVLIEEVESEEDQEGVEGTDTFLTEHDPQEEKIAEVKEDEEEDEDDNELPPLEEVDIATNTVTGIVQDVEASEAQVAAPAREAWGEHDNIDELD